MGGETPVKAVAARFYDQTEVRAFLMMRFAGISENLRNIRE